LTPAAANRRENRKLDRLRKKEKMEAERERKALYREAEAQSETETQTLVEEEEETARDSDGAVASESETALKEIVEVRVPVNFKFIHSTRRPFNANTQPQNSVPDNGDGCDDDDINTSGSEL